MTYHPLIIEPFYYWLSHTCTFLLVVPQRIQWNCLNGIERTCSLNIWRNNKGRAFQAYDCKTQKTEKDIHGLKCSVEPGFVRNWKQVWFWIQFFSSCVPLMNRRTRTDCWGRLTFPRQSGDSWFGGERSWKQGFWGRWSRSIKTVWSLELCSF